MEQLKIVTVSSTQTRYSITINFASMKVNTSIDNKPVNMYWELI
jgi:hypothetical protein